jgi:glyoxylase-like metal-dependent hydrolase (beta-lactamase superfamily II)
MNLYVLPAGPIETNAYLLTEPSRGEAVLIDAPGGVWAEVEPILSEEKCRLVELWLTHGHWDHMQGAAEVVRATGARVRAHPDDRPMIETPEIMKRFMMPGHELEPVKVDAWLKAGEIIAALGTTAEVRHVPGHCPGNVLFYFAPTIASATAKASAVSTSSRPRASRGAKADRSTGFAFVGDALFAGSVGRTDLPGGNFAVLEKSIRSQIYTLPDGTKIFPGHGPETTVGEEKQGNPYVAG